MGTAAAEHYGWVLRQWAVATLVGSALLTTALVIGGKWTRLAAVAALGAIVFAGVDPLLRLIALGWDAVG